MRNVEDLTQEELVRIAKSVKQLYNSQQESDLINNAEELIDLFDTIIN